MIKALELYYPLQPPLLKGGGVWGPEVKVGYSEWSRWAAKYGKKAWKILFHAKFLIVISEKFFYIAFWEKHKSKCSKNQRMHLTIFHFCQFHGPKKQKKHNMAVISSQFWLMKLATIKTNCYMLLLNKLAQVSIKPSLG